MLESIDKLRNWLFRYTPVARQEISELVDAIENEIAERYIPLPVDADESAEHGRKFIGLEVDMVPCNYIHGAKAPYYSIVYREDGKLFKGYSSFNIDTVSEYLRDYFIEQSGDAS